MMYTPQQPPEGDETIQRVSAALKQMPPSDPRAIARVLSAVHGRTPQPTPRWRLMLEWMRMPSLSLATASGVAVIALVAGYALNSSLQPLQSPAPATSTSLAANLSADSAVEGLNTNNPARIPVVEAAVVATDAEAPQPVQFIVAIPEAHTVSVVGDFNDWTVDQALMKFDNGAWSITLPVKPGRHEYAFVVDGKRWIADPRAPKARDNDFGKPQSVLVVTTP
ncbi:MAG: isoamylase early set domain-containing protein [Gemmatimonas sp.]